jgi:hypothetical protein
MLTLGCGLLVLLNSKTSVPSWIFINGPSGIAIGVLLVSQPIASQAASSKANMAMAASLSPFFRTVGQALGIVIGGSVFQNNFKTVMSQSQDADIRLQADTLAQNIAQLPSLLHGMSLRQAGEIRSSFSESMHTVWWVLLALTALSGLMALPIKEIALGSWTRAPSNSVEK